MKPYQVIGIGNALVDVIAPASDAFLDQIEVQKGVMQLIDMDRAVALYGQIGPAREVSGGSAANTIAGFAHLGGRCGYIGKVRDDQLGAIFAHDLRAQGADYATIAAPASHPTETGRCIVLVTPDGERTMSTYLGATEFLGPDDIDPDQMAQTDWIYLEGYRFDGAASHEAFAKAIAACKGAGGRVAITLSDPFCVDRHRDAFRALIRADVDLLFANRAELLSLYQTQDFAAALRMAADDVAIVDCTDSADGAHILTAGQHFHVPAVPTNVVDATGAGDLFAGAFMWGLVNEAAPDLCGHMGCIAASEVISHIGARPESNLRTLFAEHGVL